MCNQHLPTTETPLSISTVFPWSQTTSYSHKHTHIHSYTCLFLPLSHLPSLPYFSSAFIYLSLSLALFVVIGGGGGQEVWGRKRRSDCSCFAVSKLLLLDGSGEELCVDEVCESVSMNVCVSPQEKNRMQGDKGPLSVPTHCTNMHMLTQWYDT